MRGGRIGMIFQEPMSPLNPLHSRRRARSPRASPCTARGDARARTLELLELVGIPGRPPGIRSAGPFPTSLSGGQRQRVMIAMALANDPTF